MSQTCTWYPTDVQDTLWVIRLHIYGHHSGHQPNRKSNSPTDTADLDIYDCQVWSKPGYNSWKFNTVTTPGRD